MGRTGIRGTNYERNTFVVVVDILHMDMVAVFVDKLEKNGEKKHWY